MHTVTEYICASSKDKNLMHKNSSLLGVIYTALTCNREKLRKQTSNYNATLRSE